MINNLRELIIEDIKRIELKDDKGNVVLTFNNNIGDIKASMEIEMEKKEADEKT